jgi:Domain of unknown function (DUF4159)
MAIRLVVLFGLILFVMPGYSDGPKSDPQPEFYFTRLMYHDTRGRGGPGSGQAPFGGCVGGAIASGGIGNGGFGRGFGGGAWMTDTWNADCKYTWGIERMTNVRMSLDPHPMAIMDPDLFKYPYIYAVEVGQMELSDEEAARLREYLLRGGFLHCDDFWGLYQWAQFARQMKKVFPDRPIEELSPKHEIFHAFFDINSVLQVPNVRNGEMYTYSGGRTPTWEQRSDIEPHVRGISDDSGRLMVLITYNSDLGDAWEWMDDPDYPAQFTTYAYRMGMNSIIYAMTH